MSVYNNSQARLDRVAPQLRAAGIHGDRTEVTTAELLSTYKTEGCETPEKIRSFQHRGPDVGAATCFWARAQDPPMDSNMRHGVKASGTAGGADACLRPDLYEDKMAALLDAQRSKQYLSERRRPLGRVPDPRDPVPVPFGGFGITQPKGATTQEVLAGYRNVNVTHPAGQQTTRNYDWDAQGIDPTQHRFGKPSGNADGTTTSALRSMEQTHLRSKLAKDYTSTVANELGQPKSYGFDDPAEWDATKRGHVARPGETGKANSCFQTEQPTVRELVTTWAVSPAVVAVSEAAAAAEAEGKGRGSTTSGLGASSARMATAQGKAPVGTRYGQLKDDVRAHQLLYPSLYVSLGVESKSFAGGRTLEEVRTLCRTCGFGLADGAIDALFEEVSRDGKCSIEEFKNFARAGGYL